MKPNVSLFLLISTLIAFAIRFIGIAVVPPGLNWDESSLGYNAFSLEKTGRDEWSMPAPLIFRAFGDYKLPGYVYAAVPAIAVAGLNPATVRFPSVLFGSLLIIAIGLLAYSASRSVRVAYCATLLAIVTPWTWWLSRIALEANMALTLFCVGLALWLRSRGRLAYLIAGSVFLGLTLLTYNSYRLITPLFVILALTVICRSIFGQLSLRRKLFTFGVFALFLLPTVSQFLSGEGSARYRWVELVDAGVVSALEQYRNTSQLPAFVAKAVYNRPAYILSSSLLNFARHYAPDFLLFTGGSNYQFNPPTGLFYWWLGPFIYIGILYGVLRRKLPAWVALLLLIAPLPAALTKDAPHTLRASLLAIPLLLITSLTLVRFTRSVKPKQALFALVFVLLWSASSYAASWPNYARTYAWAWQNGHTLLSSYIKEHYGDYDRIIISKRFGEPHIFLLSDLAWDPASYQTDPALNRYFRSDWYWVDSFAKFSFVNDWDLPAFETQLQANLSTLIVSSPDNPSHYPTFKTITDLSGKPVYLLSHL